MSNLHFLTAFGAGRQRTRDRNIDCADICVVHLSKKNISGSFLSVDLDFVCRTESGRCNKGREAFNAYVMSGVKFCLITEQNMASKSIHNFFTKKGGEGRQCSGEAV